MALSVEKKRLQTPEVLLNSPEGKLLSNPKPGACLPWTCEQVMVKYLRKEIKKTVPPCQGTCISLVLFAQQIQIPPPPTFHFDCLKAVTQ